MCLEREPAQQRGTRDSDKCFICLPDPRALASEEARAVRVFTPSQLPRDRARIVGDSVPNAGGMWGRSGSALGRVGRRFSTAVAQDPALRLLAGRRELAQPWSERPKGTIDMMTGREVETSSKHLGCELPAVDLTGMDLSLPPLSRSLSWMRWSTTRLMSRCGR